MNTHLILVPIAFNDGNAVPDEVFDRLMRELCVKFGGYTLMPPAFGEWVDAHGRFVPDRHRPVMVAVPDERADELDEWLRHAGKVLDQRVMLVLRNFCEAVFIEVDS